MTQQELRNALKTGHVLHWYRIDKVLGQGGFGITYLAHDPNLDQHVAIKEYLPMELAVRDGDNSVYPASSANGERYQWGLDRFISEARTLVKFKHPAIVRVLSVFEDNNTAYMVMEYEHGESLQQLLDARKTLDEDELMPILAPLLDELEVIHATGFIHRDIKPANIYIREDGSPVLLDFGSARQALGQQTKTLTSIVSPGYAPFEQYYSKSDRQGPWTDIYSLAATLYRAISGIMPMDAIDRSEAIIKAERDVFVSAGEIGQGRYSTEFMRAIDHALNFSEKKRPQSIADWRRELGIESNNSSPVPRVLRSNREGKTIFDPRSTAENERPTELADPETASVSNAEVLQPEEISTPPARIVPVEAGRSFGERQFSQWWIAVIAVIALLVGVGLWSKTVATDGSIFGDVRSALVALFDGDIGEQVTQLVSKGDRALAAGRTFEPLKGSAVEYYRQAIALDPEHDGALQGVTLISGQMLLATEEALATGDVARAEALLGTLRKLPGQRQALQPLEEEFGVAKASAAANLVQQSRIREFLSEAATDIAEGRILAPSSNNALVRYRAIQVLDPDNEEAGRGIAAIVSRLTEEHEDAVAERNFELAGERLRQVEPLLPDQTKFAEMQQAFDNARQQDANASATEARVADLLIQAATDLKANRLANPANGNAISRYKEVLKVDPANDEATQGLMMVAARYIDLARAAIRNRRLDNARTYVAQARLLNASSSSLEPVSVQLRTAEKQILDENAALALEQERQRLALQERQREEQEQLKIELAAARQSAATEKRRRQELEAQRLFELSQSKQEAIDEQRVIESEALDRSTLVVEFDGFDDQLEIYGLKEQDVRADIEFVLGELGYNIVLHHFANRSKLTRLFVVRFRANLNSASGVFSYAASLSLYDHVPVMANSAGQSGRGSIWDKGTTGVAVQTQLRRVREEYKRTMRKFVTEVGKAPGRL